MTKPLKQISRHIVWVPLCAILVGLSVHDGKAQFGGSVFPAPSPGASSCSATGANWLTCTISGSTLTLGAAAGQTSHQVIGTCGSATAFGPCQPACSDLSNAATSCSTDTTNASNITTGTVGYSRLPTPAGGGPGGVVAVLTAPTGAISNTATQVIGYTVPSGTFAVGTTYTIEAWGVQSTSTSPGADTFSIEIGSTSLSGNIIVQDTPSATASASTAPVYVRASITVFASVVSGGMTVCGSTSGAFSTTCRVSVLSSATVSTGQSNVIELVYQSGASTSNINFTLAKITLERP